MIKKVFVSMIFLLLLTGCVFDEKEATIVMNCNKNESHIDVKKGTEFSCTLLSTSYKFTVTNVTNSYVVIKTKEKGISSGPGIWESEYKWRIEKTEPLTIHTNSTDYQEQVIFRWG